MNDVDSSCDTIKQDLNSVLEERDRLFPARNPQNDAEMHSCLGLYVQCLESRRRDKRWIPDDNLLKTALAMQENAVFICGPMKSGTTLLLELLDSHSQLNVLPGDSWLWVRFSDKAKQEVFSNEAWREHWLKRFINPTGQKPFWILGDNEQAYIALLNYIEFWLEELPETSRRPVLATVYSYFCANPNRSLSAKMWVEKTPGNEFKVDSFNANFPKSKYVHIVRDPRENFASIKRLYQSRGWSWRGAGVVRSLAASCDAAAANLEKFGRNRYLVIRYEDLTAAPEEVMEMIAVFLGIGCEKSLLVPTINTRFAKSNSMFKDRQVTGLIRPSVNDKWRQELSFHEQGLIHHIRSHADKVGYSWSMNMFDYCKSLLSGWSLIGRQCSDIKTWNNGN